VVVAVRELLEAEHHTSRDRHRRASQRDITIPTPEATSNSPRGYSGQAMIDDDNSAGVHEIELILEDIGV